MARPKMRAAPAAAPARGKSRPMMRPRIVTKPHRVPSFEGEPEYPEEVLTNLFYRLVNATHAAAKAFPGIAAKTTMDWQTPIYCTYFFSEIDDELFDFPIVAEMIRESVLYFTGTHAEVIPLARRTVSVHADGYAKGPHGNGGV